jgi:hypothetical protein
MWIVNMGKGPPRPTRVSTTPLGGHDVPVHNNHQEVAGVRADGQDTRCGISLVEACGQEECLAELTDTPGVEAGKVEGANPDHSKQLQENNHSSE